VNRLRATRPAAALTAVIAAIALSGCAPTPEAAYSAAVRQATEELRGLSPDAAEEAAMRRSAAVESDAWRLAGLDDNTAESTSELLGAALDPTLAWASSERAHPSAIALISTAVSPGSFATTIGLGFIAVDAATGTAIVKSNDGATGSHAGEVPGGTSAATVGEDGTVHAEVSTAASSGGVDTAVAASTDLGVCPDAEGRLEMSADVTVRVERGDRGASLEMHVDATGLLDDDANLVGSNYEYRQQYASFADGAGEFLDHSGNAAGDVSVNRHSDAVTADFVTSAAVAAAMMAAVVADNLQRAAEKGWASGRCVDVTLTPSQGPDGLDPDAEVTIDAAAKSTVDGSATRGTMVATLTGEGGVSPSESKLDAPATFTYSAPSEKDKTGTVKVESRSKRGIGTSTLTLSTGAGSYSASGGREEYAGAGTVCSLTDPFTIPGNTVTFTFSPAGASGGTWTASGGAWDLTFTGDGSYTVVYADAVATTIVLSGTVATIAPDGSRYPGSADLEFALTPIDDCS